MQVIEKAKETEFLGSEFLLWLWFKSETDGAVLNLGESGEAELHFQGKMTLESKDEKAKEVLTCSARNSQMKEARFALGENKMVTEASLRLSTPDSEWTFSFDSRWMNIKSLRLTGTNWDRGEDPEGFFYEKAALIERAAVIVDEFFTRFIRIRISPHWESEELPTMLKWIRQGKER